MVGRLLGTSPLGEYTFAWNLAAAPADKVSAVVVRVMPAVFSAVQDEYAALRRYLRLIMEGLCVLIFPPTIGLALVAHEFVPLVLGKNWEGAIVPLQLLAFYTSFRSIVSLLPQVLTVIGETRFVMTNTIATFVVMTTAFYISSRWGTTGIAAAWIIAYPVVIIPMYRRTLRKIHLSAGEYIRGALPPLSGVVAMAIVVGSLKWAMPLTWPLQRRFLIEVVGGASTYLFLMAGLYGARLRVLWQFVRNLRRKQSVSYRELDLGIEK